MRELHDKILPCTIYQLQIALGVISVVLILPQGEGHCFHLLHLWNDTFQASLKNDVSEGKDQQCHQ
jgi:hypothetical protein